MQSMKENIPSKWQGKFNLFANPFKSISFEFEVNVSLMQTVEHLREKNGESSGFMGDKTDTYTHSLQPNLYEFQIKQYGRRTIGVEAKGYLKQIDDTSTLISGKVTVSPVIYLFCIIYFIFIIYFVLSTPPSTGFSIFMAFVAFISFYVWLVANYQRIDLVNWMKDNLKKKPL
jgi:hypothetical protein